MLASLAWLTDSAKTRGALPPGKPDPRIIACGSVGGVIDKIRQGLADAVLASLPLEGCSVEELLASIRSIDSTIPVILLDETATLTELRRLTRLGAFYCTSRPFDSTRLTEVMDAAMEHRAALREKREAAHGALDEPWLEFLIGESRPMLEVAEVIRLVGMRRSTVLITGATGTGKEVVARAIHMASGRAHLPMVAVNCAALPAQLLEAELFGHTKGAFTGAVGNRVGLFEQANHGTIFLDEVGEMPLEMQSKLLRVLQEREIQRVGSSQTIRLDTRIIAATNVSLEDAIQRGTFRGDLYYRLNVVPIHMPPLVDRLSDIPLLVNYFMDQTCEFEALPRKRISQDALALLSSYSWPGNVRQLAHAVESAIALSGDRRVLYPVDFPVCFETETGPGAEKPFALGEVPAGGMDFEATIVGIERSLLKQALHRCGGNKAKAADLLGMKRTTLLSKMKALDYCAAR